MFIFITPSEWGWSRLRFSASLDYTETSYYEDWYTQTYGFESDTYPSSWAS